MQLRTGINGFTIVLICSLVPLVSLAPAVTPEGRITTDQRHFTTKINILAAMLEMKATALFKNFATCHSLTDKTLPWLLADSQARERVQAIPECPAFKADCCALHAFFRALKPLVEDMEGICDNSSAQALNATLNQLEVTLNEGSNAYVCPSEDLPQQGVHEPSDMGTSQRMIYVWWLLHKYDQFMRNTTKLYSPSGSMSG